MLCRHDQGRVWKRSRSFKISEFGAGNKPSRNLKPIPEPEGSVLKNLAPVSPLRLPLQSLF